MENDIVGIINPYAKLLPESINNNIIDYTSPEAIHNAYNYGMINGVILNNDQTPYPYRKFAQYNFDFLKANQEDNESIFFEDTKYYGQIRNSGTGKRILQYKTALEIDKSNYTGAQVVGDCSSWAVRQALDTLRCLQIANGMWQDWICRQATAMIYRSRGYNGHGSDPIALTANAIKLGTLLEKVYKLSSGDLDFTNYKTYVRWASNGRSGIPAELVEQTKPFHANNYKIVKTTDALLDLMASGGTVQSGSMLGVSSYGDFISRRSGSWNHSMSIIGVDDTREFSKERLWIYDQTWGRWNKVTNIPDVFKPWPEGAFCITDTDCQYAVRSGGTNVIFGGEFFPVKDFSNSII